MTRHAGILMHITSLPSPYGIGTMGKAAYKFADFLQQAGQTTRRATRSEIKILSTVDVAQLQKDTDRMAQRLRLLDNKLQQTNWSTELS